MFSRGATQRQLVVSLLPEAGFLAKNQLPSQAPEWITVPGISHLNPSKAERMLCPVRQLWGVGGTFVHWNRNIRDIMRNHISRWIVETVKEAYTQADREYDELRSEHCQHHECTTVRWPYLTSCQRRFGGHVRSSRIRIYGTWLVSLMACLLWVQWWSHNK